MQTMHDYVSTGNKQTSYFTLEFVSSLHVCAIPVYRVHDYDMIIVLLLPLYCTAGNTVNSG